MNKIYKAFVLGGALLLLSVNFASAAEILAPKDQDATLTVGATETHHNVYAGASTLTVNGNITGDAFLAGGTVTENGNVEADLAAAGGTLVLNSSVGGDLRAAGGTVTVNGPITGDLLVAGGTVNITDKASVTGDLLAAGGTVDIAAPVTGSVNVRGGSVTINSKITGNVFVEANKQLTFGPNAQVSGKVYFKGVKEAVVEQGAVVSSIEFSQLKNARGAKGAVKAIFTGAILIKLLAWIIAILLLIKFLPGKTSKALEIAHAKPWASLGIGFVSLVVAPILSFVLFITLIGYFVGFIILAVYVTLLVFASLIAALFLGDLIVKWLMKKAGPVLDWQSAVIGVAVFMLIGFVPVLGWLACAMLMLIAFGSLVQMLKSEIHQ